MAEHKDVFIVYATDQHHAKSVRHLLGVATNNSQALKICETAAQRDGQQLTKQHRFQLANHRQTQGYSSDREFIITEVTPNKFLG